MGKSPPCGKLTVVASLCLLLVTGAAALGMAVTPGSGVWHVSGQELLWQEFRPVQWTAQQVESMRSRALLQAGGQSPPQPVCELGLTYRVLDLPGTSSTSSSSSTSATITIANNREVCVVYVWACTGERGVWGRPPGVPLQHPPVSYDLGHKAGFAFLVRLSACLTPVNL